MPFFECTNECNTSGIQVPASCELSPRDGGISRLIFIPPEAGITPANANLLNTWIDAATQCNIYVTGRLKGQKPKHTTTTEKLTSCLPAQITGATKTISFLDYNAYDTLIDYDFWDTIYQEQTLWKVMAVACDGRIYPMTSFSLDVDEVIPEDSKSPSHYDGVITFDNDGSIVKTFYWEEMLNVVLTQRCTCSPYVDCTSNPGYVEFEIRIPESFELDGDINYDITIACCDPVNGNGCFGTNDYITDYFGYGTPSPWAVNIFEFIDPTDCIANGDFECVFSTILGAMNGLSPLNGGTSSNTYTMVDDRTALFSVEISTLQYQLPGCFSDGVVQFCNRKTPLMVCPQTNFQSDADNCTLEGFIQYDFFINSFSDFPVLDGLTPYTIEFTFDSDCGQLPSLPPGYLFQYNVIDAVDDADLANKIALLIDADISPFGGTAFRVGNAMDGYYVRFRIPLSEYAGLDPDCICNDCPINPPGKGNPTATMQNISVTVNEAPSQTQATAFCCPCDVDPADFQGIPGSVCYPGSEGQEGDPPVPDCDLNFTLFVHESMISGGGTVISWSNPIFGQPDRNPTGTPINWVIPATPTADIPAFLVAAQAVIEGELNGAGIPYTYNATTNGTTDSALITFTINTADAYLDKTVPLCNCSGTNVGFGDNDSILVVFESEFGSSVQDNRTFMSVECCACPSEPLDVCEYPDNFVAEGCWFENDFDGSGDDEQSIALVWPATFPDFGYNNGCMPYLHLGLAADTWTYTLQPGDDLQAAVDALIINVTNAYNVVGVPITITKTTDSPGLQQCIRIEFPVSVLGVGTIWEPTAIDRGCGCNCHVDENEYKYGETSVDMIGRTYFATANFAPFDMSNYDVGLNQKVELTSAERLECCDCDGEEVVYEPDSLCPHVGYYKFTFDFPAGIGAGDLVAIDFNNSCFPVNIPFGNGVSYTVQGGDSSDVIFAALITELQNNVDSGVVSVNTPSMGGDEEFWIPVINSDDGVTLNFGPDNPGDENLCDCYCDDGIANGYGFMQPNMTAEFDWRDTGGGVTIIDITVECCDCQEVI